MAKRRHRSARDDLRAGFPDTKDFTRANLFYIRRFAGELGRMRTSNRLLDKRLRYIVIKLKSGKFEPEHLGQLGFYVALIDD